MGGMLIMSAMTASGQTIAEELMADPNRAAGNFYALPIGKMPKDNRLQKERSLFISTIMAVQDPIIVKCNPSMRSLMPYLPRPTAWAN